VNAASYLCMVLRGRLESSGWPVEVVTLAGHSIIIVHIHRLKVVQREENQVRICELSKIESSFTPTAALSRSPEAIPRIARITQPIATLHACCNRLHANTVYTFSTSVVRLWIDAVSLSPNRRPRANIQSSSRPA
jgi:hypothetical protein